MADALQLAIDIGSGKVTAVLFGVDKRSFTVVDSYCSVFDTREKMFEALGQALSCLSASDIPCYVSISPYYYFFRSLDVPFTDQKQVASVLIYELQDSVTLADGDYINESLLYDKNNSETSVLAILLRKELIKDLLAVFRENDFDPEIITVCGLPAIYNHCRIREHEENSFVYLDVGFNLASVYLVKDAKVRLIRPIPFDSTGSIGFFSADDGKRIDVRNKDNLSPVMIDLARKVNNTIVALRRDAEDYSDLPWFISGEAGNLEMVRSILLDNLDVVEKEKRWFPYDAIERIDIISDRWALELFSNVLALGSSRVKNLELINFRKDDFARKHSRNKIVKIIKTVSILVIALLVIAVGGIAVEYNQVKTRRDNLAGEIKTIYKETIPGDSRIVNPVQQLTVKVNELKNTTSMGSSGPIDFNTVVLLRDISERVPKSLNVKFERFIYDRQSIRIKGLTDNFNTVDQMKRYLSESPYYNDVAIVSANVAPKDKGVKFELKMQL